MREDADSFFVDPPMARANLTRETKSSSNWLKILVGNSAKKYTGVTASNSKSLKGSKITIVVV